MADFISTFLEKWERYASVRSHPRKFFLNINPESGYFFPPSKQPLWTHPKVANLGENAKQLILLHSFYKYSNDIAQIEINTIASTVIDIATQRLPIKSNMHIRQIALSILTDEAYHGFVALDSIRQVEKLTGIECLPMPLETELSFAIQQIKKNLPPSLHSLFKLIAVCIAENTVTKDLVMMQDMKETNATFQHIVKEHLSDEARHAGFFQFLLKQTWEYLDANTKIRIGEQLACFIYHYLNNSFDKAFSQTLLTSLNVSSRDTHAIMEDTYGEYKISISHPMLKNILLQLERAGVLRHPSVYENMECCSLI